MKQIFSKIETVGFLLIFLSILILYRDVFFQGKIMFPSNFLAQHYSPWSSEKFKGWERGIHHKPIGIDQIRFFYPSRTFTNEMIKNGSIPLWNPYIFSGVPHVADYQSAVFYPLNILYFFLPQIIAWSILIFIQSILATLFTYLYLRLFSIHKIAAFFGALSFGFSGFMIVWSQENAVVSQAALWLPLVLFGIEGFLKTNKAWYFIVAVFALASSFLGGFFQATFYISVLAFLYGLFRIYESRNHSRVKFLSILIMIFFLAFGISSIQLVPSIEGFFESPRTTSSVWYLFDLYLLPITHIFNILAPDVFGSSGAYNFFGRGFYHETVLYIGIIPLVFAVFASFKLKTYRIILFFTIAALLSFFLTLKTPFTTWFYHLPLPLISTFLPSRILVITTFSLAVLSAFGFSLWVNKKKNNENLINSIYIAFVFILSVAFLYGTILFFIHTSILQSVSDFVIRPNIKVDKNLSLVMIKNTALPLLLLIASFMFIKIKKRYLSLFGLIAFTFLGQFYFLNKYLVLGFSQFLYPNHPVFAFLEQYTASPDRFLTFGLPILGNIAIYKHLYSPEGLDPIFPNRYGQLLFAAKNKGRLTKDIPRIEATLSELGEKESLVDNKRRLRLMSLLGVKYIVYYNEKDIKYSVEKRFPKEFFSQIWNSSNWHGFVYKNSFDRAFLVDNFLVENNPQTIVNLLFDKNIDLSKTTILEKKPNMAASSGQAMKNTYVKIKRYKPQKIEIVVNTDKPRILFLSDNYYPGWKAMMDNSPTKIYRANYTFRAVVVPKGEHVVSFLYDPSSFKIGKAISIISIIFLACIFIFRNFLP